MEIRIKNIFICTTNRGKLTEFKHIFKNEPLFSISDIESAAGIKYPEPVENSDYFLSNGFVKIFSALQFIASHVDKKSILIENVIADDSGLCIPALHFIPGVHSATFGGEPRDDKKNRLKVIQKIAQASSSLIYNNEKRMPAFFVCFLFSVSLSSDVNFVKVYQNLQAKDFLSKELISLEQNLLKEIESKKASGNKVTKVPLSFFHKKFPDNIFVNIYCGFCWGEVSTKEQNLIQGAGHGYDSMFYGAQNRELSFASISLEEKNRQSHRAFAMQALTKNGGPGGT